MRLDEAARRLRALAVSKSFRQAAEALGNTNRDALQSWAKDNVPPEEYTRLCIRSAQTRAAMADRANDAYSRNEGPKPLKAPLTEEGLESLAVDAELLGTAVLEVSSTTTPVSVANLGRAVLDTLEAQAKELKGLREELSQTEDRAKRELQDLMHQRDILRHDRDAALKRIAQLEGGQEDKNIAFNNESKRILKTLGLKGQEAYD